MNNKIYVISLGCAKNRYDMEASLADFLTLGYEIVYNPEDADFIIINTCSFIKSAREEARETIIEAIKVKTNHSNIKIIVCGCYPQKFKDELLNLFGNSIDAYCGIEMHKYIIDILNNINNYVSNIQLPGKQWFEPINGRVNTLSPFVGDLKISEGCNNRCSYCAIPSIRGDLRSRPEEAIINEATYMSDNGIIELNIIAQDITAYNKDKNIQDALPDLIYKLNEIKGSLKWIRLLYAYPTEITENLVNAIKNCDKVVKYLDLPLQHGDNQVLKDMNRRGTSEEYLDKIQMLKESVPNICLRSTFIVGYPTETDYAFNNLIDFVQKAEFDRAGFFTYSKEINTPAYNINSTLPQEVIEERADILGQVLQKISLVKNQNLIGKNLDVLCEEKDKNYVYGRTYRDAIDIDGIIKIKTKKNMVGKIIKNVQITGCDEYDLEGII